MKTTADLPADVRDTLQGRDLIVFDGECVLCSGFFRFIVRADKTQRFHFAHAQSDLGARIYAALGMPTDDFDTNLVIVDSMIYERLDAFAAAMTAVGWPYKALAVTRFIPEPLRSFLYYRIAKNRYAVFGRYDTCMMPDAGLRARFLDGVA
ncbi:thiol-disulfide oxidoreductase DCC family protein [Gymnodinialimonas sp.]